LGPLYGKKPRLEATPSDPLFTNSVTHKLTAEGLETSDDMNLRGRLNKPTLGHEKTTRLNRSKNSLKEKHPKDVITPKKVMRNYFSLEKDML